MSKRKILSPVSRAIESREKVFEIMSRMKDAWSFEILIRWTVVTDAFFQEIILGSSSECLIDVSHRYISHASISCSRFSLDKLVNARSNCNDIRSN